VFDVAREECHFFDIYALALVAIDNCLQEFAT